MSISDKYFDPETLARLRTLSLRGRHLVEGFMAGMHANRQRGHSIEFAEHREYSPGDDIRRVDWRVYARTDRYFLKQYEDETNLSCVLAVDTSESMRYAGPKSALTKFEYAQLAVLSLAYLVLDQRDAGGLAMVSDRIDSMLEPSNQIRHWQNMISVLESSKLQRAANMATALGELASRIHKRSLVILVSDFLDDLMSLERGCRHLRHQKHDLILLQVLDRTEIEFPFERTTRFLGLEGSGDLTIDPTALRRAYLDRIQRHQGQLSAMAARMEMDYQLLVTDQALSRVLPLFLALRQHRQHR